jgi:hypothetical protein
VDITDTGKSIVKQYEMWFDPAVGLAPRRVKMEGVGGGLKSFTIIIDSWDFKQIADGVWFPAKQAHIQDDISNNGSACHSVATIKALELRGDRKYTKDQLVPKFPSGTEISESAPNLQWVKKTVP